MTVSIIAGRGGTGKTSQVCGVVEMFDNFRWALMEIKDKRSLKSLPVDIIVSINDEYKVDPVKTLNNFQDWKDTVINYHKPECIVVDGISDLRNYAMDEWLIRENERRSAEGLRPRKTIGGDNLSAWAAINDRVRNILEPLINYGITTETHVFFTAEMKLVYRKNTVIGIEPNIKEWIEYPCECIIILYKDGEKYWCESTKTPLWSSGTFTETLEKDSGLLQVMMQHNLL